MTDLDRVVFDCNTFLQALASPGGPAGRCIQLAIDEKVNLVVSPVVIEELRDVARRPKVMARLHFTPERTEEFIDVVEGVADMLAGFPEPFVYERDPDDAHYVNLALTATAKWIVSRDKDLLDLMDSTKPESEDFQNRFPQLRILDPVSFLREFESRNDFQDIDRLE